ncbi:MAG: lamin tail domain-containing protein [Candidatus Marinimicrobia bacterium]|nr:lamin tail domain-containing protein [Candidatus Neomarinimicrobiota bacterium]
MKTALKGLCITVLMFAFTSIAFGDIFITEIADPNGGGYAARFVELFNNGSEDVDLSEGWSLARYTNGNDYITTRLALRGVIPAGGFYVSCRHADDFMETFGFAADLDGHQAGPVDSNGDDNIVLYNPAWEVVDIYGRPGEDGTGTDHEFEDGRAERVSTVTTGNPTFDPAEWDIDNDSGGGDGPQEAPADFDPRAWFTHASNPFNILEVKTLDNLTVTVSYTYPVDSVTAVMAANYDIGGVAPLSITAESNMVVLTLAVAMTHPTDYVLTVNDVYTLDSSLTIGTNSTAAFSYYEYSGKVVISEFTYNSEGSDNEWFEIFNASAETIDLTGWLFRDEPTSHSPIIIQSTTDNVLAPGEYFTIFAYGDGVVNGWPLHFTPDVNGAVNYADTSHFHMWNLNNSDDIIYMWDSMGNLVDSVAYDQSLPNTVPVEAYLGIGHTVEIINPMASNDDPTNWQASYFYGGTPGLENVTIAPVYPGVVISEVMYHSSLDDSAQVEWIELFNTEDDSVDIGGWYTMDDNPTHVRTPFPVGTKIGPGEYLSVFNYVSSDTFVVPFTPDYDISDGDIGYSDSKDNPLLFNAEDDLVSYMYYDDGGAGEMFEHASGADGLGYSLELIDPLLSNHDPLNWKASSGLGGTPGTEPLDEFPPTILNVSVVDLNTINVAFSESVDSVTATTLINYSVDGGIGVPSAAVWSDYQVALTIGALVHETDYTLTVSNVADVSGNVIDTLSTMAFTYQAYVDMIVINEFQYNSEYYDNEFIELYNASADTIDILGWYLRDEPTSHQFLVVPDSINTVMLPGDYFTIYVYGEGEEKGWPLHFTPDLQAAIDYTDTTRNHLWNLNNSGDMIYLWDDLGNLTDFVDYHTDQLAYPDPARWGTGLSCELIDPAMDRNDPASWQPSYFYGGTPGALNILEAPVYPAIVVNEIMYNAAGDVEYEWIELFNAGDVDIDISGWYMMDDNPTHGRVGIPEGTTLAAGDFYTLLNHVEVDTFELPFTPDFDVTEGGIGLSNSRDNCIIFNAADVMMTFMHYDDGTPDSGDDFQHAPEADGTGPTLALIDATASNWDPINWIISLEDGGTPGIENFDVTGPAIVSAAASSDTSVVLTFSEVVHPATGEHLTNYSFDNGIGTPLAAEADGNIVTLITTPFTVDLEYTITMNNIWDMLGNAIEANSTISFTSTFVGVHDGMLPDEYALNQNYPNPFNPVTTISYALPEVADVTLRIYDITGREIHALVDESQPAGWYDLKWSGLSAQGTPVSTGMYFARIQAGGYTKVIKMLYLK